MAEQLALSLSPPPPSNTVIINSRCTLRIEGEQRVVVVSALPVHHYSANDVVAEAYATVFLVDSGFATQREVALAFECSVRTVWRHQQRYADRGMTALGHAQGGGRVGAASLRSVGVSSNGYTQKGSAIGRSPGDSVSPRTQSESRWDPLSSPHKLCCRCR